MRLIHWALWSRTRLMLAAAGALTGMFVVSSSMALVAPTPDDAAVGPAGTVTGSPTAGATPGVVVDLSDPTTVAVGFLTAMMSPDRDTTDWVEGMRPYAESTLIAEMYAVDTTQVPTGAPKKVALEAETTSNALVSAKVAKATVIYVGLVPTEDGWKVTALTGSEPE